MITSIEQMRANHALGQTVFEKIFQLDSKDIKNKLKELIDSEFIADYLLKEGSVQKITINDEPWKILIHFHDELVIDAYGIVFNGEHSKQPKTLICFTSKSFKLD